MLKKVKKNFYVKMELNSEDGTILSSNEYLFLIGNQKEASEKFKKLGEQIRERNEIYSYGNYYRFFDILTGENGQEYESKTDTIKPRKF